MKQPPVPSDYAGGLPALRSTFAHAKKSTGLVKGLLVLGAANQKFGFDCPGCAWPDPEHRALAEFCENGAKAILDEATSRSVDPELLAAAKVSELFTRTDRELNDLGRITQPYLKHESSETYVPCSYEEAYDVIATRLQQLSCADEAAFYTSGRASNEAAFLYQLLVRALGTNNLPDCSNLCHESSGVALMETLGIGKGTVRLSDFQAADLIFVIGQNPGSNHPRMLGALREAKLSGARIISVNPLREAGLVRFEHPAKPVDMLDGGVALADDFVRVRVNGDQAFFRGLNKALLEADAEGQSTLDRAFLEEFTDGLPALQDICAKTTWAQIEEQSGVSEPEIRRVCDVVRASKSIICCWAMGLTQHQNAVITIQEVSNFLLLRGNVGRPGAGVCPVRGHSNVQGDRSMGIAVQLPDEFRKNMEQRFGLKVPKRPGLDTVRTIRAMHAGEVKVLVALGGHFLGASPDTEFTRQALTRCELTVHISTKLNRSHFAAGKCALILPCLGRTERDIPHLRPEFVTVENSMGIIHASRGTRPPHSPSLRGEPRIIAEIAERLLSEGALPFGTKPRGVSFSQLSRDYGAIRRLIEEVVPKMSGYDARVAEPGGFELENGPRERHFPTPQGRAQLTADPLLRAEPQAGELLLMTLRSHDQFNTTVYSDNDRYRGVSESRRVLLMHPEDLGTRGLSSGDLIDVESRYTSSDGREQSRRVTGFSALSYGVPRGSAAAYFPEANPLVILDSVASRSNTPTSKSIRIVVQKSLNSHSASSTKR